MRVFSWDNIYQNKKGENNARVFDLRLQNLLHLLAFHILLSRELRSHLYLGLYNQCYISHGVCIHLRLIRVDEHVKWAVLVQQFGVLVLVDTEQNNLVLGLEVLERDFEILFSAFSVSKWDDSLLHLSTVELLHALELRDLRQRGNGNTDLSFPVLDAYWDVPPEHNSFVVVWHF